MSETYDREEWIKPINELSKEHLEYLAINAYEIALPNYTKAELKTICCELEIHYIGRNKSNMIDGILEYRKERGLKMWSTKNY